MPVTVSEHFLEWFLDKSEERHFDTAIDVAVGSALHFAADARRYTQGKLFDLGVWNFNNSLEAQERADDYFCPSAAWGCWIPGQAVATGGLMIGFAPLFAATVVPYTGPWAVVTAPVAFALDAYNIYRYFD